MPLKIFELLIPGSQVEISGTHGQRINTLEARLCFLITNESTNRAPVRPVRFRGLWCSSLHW